MIKKTAGYMVYLTLLCGSAFAQSLNEEGFNERISLAVSQVKELDGSEILFTAHVYRDAASELLGANVFGAVLTTERGDVELRARSEAGRSSTLGLIDCIGQNGGSCLISGTAVVQVGDDFGDFTRETPNLVITDFSFGIGEKNKSSQQTLAFVAAYRNALAPVMSMNGDTVQAVGSIMHILNETYFVDFGALQGALDLDAGYDHNNAVRTSFADGAYTLSLGGTYELMATYSNVFPLLPEIRFILIEVD